MSGVEKVKSSLLNDVREIISAARSQAVRSVDSCRVQMYWHIGRRIFEEEQLGKDRADYGTYLIKNLAKQLERSMAVVFHTVSWPFVVSFIVFIQL